MFLLYSKLETLDCLNLPIIRAVKIPFRGADVSMAHQRLDSLKVNALIQKGCSKDMPDHMGMDPFPNQSFFCHRFGIIPFPSSHEVTTHGFWGEGSLTYFSSLPSSYLWARTHETIDYCEYHLWRSPNKNF
jgi:hypothetical protein